MPAVLDRAADRVLHRGVGLGEESVLEVLRLDDEHLEHALALAHEVRMRWCGPEVEVEGIVSVKTGGCPEDCHFCSQSGRFDTPVRAARLDIPSLVEAARQTAATGATEFCIVAAVRGPDDRLMAQVREAVAAIHARGRDQRRMLARDPHPRRRRRICATSECTATTTTSRRRARHFPAGRHHPYLGRTLGDAPARAGMGMEVCCGGIIGMGESIEQRAEFAAPARRPRPRRGAAELPRSPARHAVRGAAGRSTRSDALKAIAAFRLALPRTVLRFAGGRELTLGDLGTRQGMLGGINAVIVGNYLTTLGRVAPGP